MMRVSMRLAALVCFAFFAATGAAQSYPAKPLRLIVPFAPGGVPEGHETMK